MKLIQARLHGFLDDAVVLTYLIGARVLGLRAMAMGIALLGALVHFFITRFTDYPQGFVKLLRFRTHGFIELAEGIGVLVATWTLLEPEITPASHRLFLTLLGISQLVAFAISDYRWPESV
jgi:hypothetical protein